MTGRRTPPPPVFVIIADSAASASFRDTTGVTPAGSNPASTPPMISAAGAVARAGALALARTIHRAPANAASPISRKIWEN